MDLSTMTQYSPPTLSPSYYVSAGLGFVGVVTPDRVWAAMAMLASAIVGFPVACKWFIYGCHAGADLVRAFRGIPPVYPNEKLADINTPTLPPAQATPSKPVECVTPNADGTPGCHGQGPGATPAKKEGG